MTSSCRALCRKGPAPESWHNPLVPKDLEVVMPKLAVRTTPPKNENVVQFELGHKMVKVRAKAASMLFRIFDRKDGTVMDLSDNELFQIVEFIQREFPDVARRRRNIVCHNCPKVKKNP